MGHGLAGGQEYLAGSYFGGSVEAVEQVFVSRPHMFFVLGL